MPEPHDIEFSRHRVAHIGTRFRYVCSCGERSPLVAREAAELAAERHRWQVGQSEEFRR